MRQEWKTAHGGLIQFVSAPDGSERALSACVYVFKAGRQAVDQGRHFNYDDDERTNDYLARAHAYAMAAMAADGGPDGTLFDVRVYSHFGWIGTPSYTYVVAAADTESAAAQAIELAKHDNPGASDHHTGAVVPHGDEPLDDGEDDAEPGEESWSRA